MSLPRRDRAATAVALALGVGWIVAPMAQAGAPEPRTVAWRAGLPEARTEAAGARRLVWLQFTGEACYHCQRMEAEAFRDPKVLAMAGANFVPVRLRVEGNEELALSFGLSALPATVILRPDGGEVAKVQGYLDPAAYVSFLNDALTRHGRVPTTTAGGSTAAEKVVDALGGFCPVSLVDAHKLVAGRADLAETFDGASYRFASASAREAFRKDPDRYAPRNGGRCPVARVERGEARAGSPRWGAVYEGHLYLCGGEADRAAFLRRPARYAAVDVAERGFCPHCWASERLLVRGLPSQSVTRGGRCYLFPEAAHREAFLANDAAARR